MTSGDVPSEKTPASSLQVRDLEEVHPTNIDLESPIGEQSPRSPAVDTEGTNEWSELYKAQPFKCISLFPPLTWIPRYRRCLKDELTDDDTRWVGTLPYSIKGDVIAGLTIGVMLVPQCMAFALLAGLPVYVGLYSSFAPLLVYAAFGTLRQVQPGPTAVMSLLTGQALDSLGLVDMQSRMAGASLLAALVGAVSLLMGILRVGGIVDFMSHSVMAAFCTAAGVTIATSQLKDMFGLTIPRSHYWWETVGELLHALKNTHAATTVMGFSILFVLLFMKSWKTAGSKAKREKHRLWRFFPKDNKSIPFKMMKFVADLSSLMAVLLGVAMNAVFKAADIDDVKIVGKVNTEGFVVKVPGHGIAGDLMSDSTLLLSAAIISVIGFLETAAVGGKFAAQYKYDYVPNQDLIATGLMNCAAGVMAGYPVTGSFSRTAVNAAFGATSLLSCALSSTLVFMAVYFLLPVLAEIPKASMAPIIIQGAFGVIDTHEFWVALKTNKAEFFIMTATLIVALALTVKEGLLVGFVLSVLFTLAEISKPNLALVVKVDHNWRDVRYNPQGEQPENVVVIRMDARLHFANARRLKEFCMRALQIRERQGRNRVEYLLIDAKAMNGIDVTGGQMLAALAESLKSRGQKLLIANIKAPLLVKLDNAGLVRALLDYGGHVCLDVERALAVVKKEELDWSEEEAKVRDMLENYRNLQRAACACSAEKR